MVAGDDAEHDRSVEVDDGPADLGAVLELHAPQRLGGPVEAGQVGQHHERAVAAAGVDRPRGLLRRPGEQRAGGPLIGSVGREAAAPRHRS